MTNPAARVANLLSQALNALGLLAAPRAWDQWNPGIDKLAAVREALVALGTGDEFASGAGTMPEGFVDELARFADALGGEGPTAEQVTGARSLLSHAGIPEPAGGWDAFDGYQGD